MVVVSTRLWRVPVRFQAVSAAWVAVAIGAGQPRELE